MQSASSRLNDFWKLKLLRPTKDDILTRCKFLIRRCKFYEMCDAAADCGSTDGEDSPYVTALLYLQTSLADVTDASSQQEFLACMGYLLASQSRGNRLQREDTAITNTDEEDDMMASQVLTSSNVGGSKTVLEGDAPKVDKLRWERRTQVFEAIMAFLPEDAVQPKDNLVSCTNAWEGLL